jgi:hypothetical protein
MKEFAMTHTNPTAPPAAHEATPDTQTLITLLQGLMPLLLGIQQSQAQPSYQFERGNLPNLLLPNAMLDHQAAVALVEDITADCLRTLSTYLESHAERHPELQDCVGIVTHGVHCFAARDLGQAFDSIWQAYRALAALHAVNPQLPPLRAASPAHSASSPPTTSIH